MLCTHDLVPRGLSPGTTPGNTIQSLWIKRLKLMKNSPSLGESWSTHSAIFFTSCQQPSSTFHCQTKVSYWLFIGKSNKQMYPIFCTLFAHFHKWTTLPGKAVTLPVALLRPNPVGMSPVILRSRFEN